MRIMGSELVGMAPNDGGSGAGTDGYEGAGCTGGGGVCEVACADLADSGGGTTGLGAEGEVAVGCGCPADGVG